MMAISKFISMWKRVRGVLESASYVLKGRPRYWPCIYDWRYALLSTPIYRVSKEATLNPFLSRNFPADENRFGHCSLYYSSPKLVKE